MMICSVLAGSSQNNTAQINSLKHPSFAYASTLSLYNNENDLLFLAGSVSRTYGKIGLADLTLFCCTKAENDLKIDNLTYTYINHLPVADSIVSVFYAFSKTQKTLNLIAKSFISETTRHRQLHQLTNIEKPLHIFIQPTANNKAFVIGILEKAKLHVIWVSPALAIKGHFTKELTKEVQNIDRLESYLDTNGIFCLAIGQHLKKPKKKKITLMRLVLTNGNFATQTVDDIKIISDDFKITANHSGNKIALAGTMPDYGIDAFGLKYFPLGFYCLEFNRQLKLESHKNVPMTEDVIKKVIGERKAPDLPSLSTYRTPIGNFTTKTLKYTEADDLVVVYEDTPSKSEYHYGNIAIISFGSDNTETISTIPRISKLAGNFSWQQDTLFVDYVLDIKPDFLETDKNNRLSFYPMEKKAQKAFTYGFIREAYYDGALNIKAKQNLESFNALVLGFTYSKLHSTLYFLLDQGAYKDNELIIIKEL